MNATKFSPRRVSALAFGMAGLLWVAAQARLNAAEPIYAFTNFVGMPGGGGSYDGLGGQARFRSPYDLAADAAGNVYVADTMNHTIRKVTPAGLVTTFAGLADARGTNDGQISTARFSYPRGIAVAGDGTLFLSDGNHTIRKISYTGAVTTYAGTPGQSGYADGHGINTRFFNPAGIAVDTSGNVYVADANNKVVRKIAPDRQVTTLAGSPGEEGTSDGQGSNARFRAPEGLAVDGAGNVYVADSYANTVRRISADGFVSTLAGSPDQHGTVDGQGTLARFRTPRGVVVGLNGDLYVADSNNQAIRKVTGEGLVTTFAGSVTNAGNADGIGVSARFRGPNGVAIDAQGNIYVADTGNSTVRKITTDAAVATLAGRSTQSGSIDGLGEAARFTLPKGMAVDGAGNLYLVDSSPLVRKVTPQGQVTTIAGRAGVHQIVDGIGTNASFYNCEDIAVDEQGNLFVTEGFASTVRKITPEGAVSTLAGMADQRGGVDGTGSMARFYGTQGVATDSAGNVYVADVYNNKIRKITPAGVVTTVRPADATFGFSFPTDVAVDKQANVLYILDSVADTIYKLTADGVISAFAGSPFQAGAADGVGTAARFDLPSSIAVDRLGNLYVTDGQGSTIRKITRTGIVTTIGGTRNRWGDRDGVGANAEFQRPSGIAVDNDLNVYVVDTENHRITKGTPLGSTDGIAHQFRATNAIIINDSAVASPYPSTIEVSGLQGPVTGLVVRIHNFAHTYPSDVGMLLVGPQGQKAVLMNRAGGTRAVTNVTLTFDQNATHPIPNSAIAILTNGTYRPADYRPSGFYTFTAPAPTGPYTNDLRVFNGVHPNGTWKLYVLDDLAGDRGTIDAGWELVFGEGQVSETNHPPTITLSTNQVVSRAGTLTPILGAFLADPDTPAGDLNLVVSTSNSNVVSPAHVFFSGSGAARSITIMPIGEGSATLTFKVDDGKTGASAVVYLSSLRPSRYTFIDPRPVRLHQLGVGASTLAVQAIPFRIGKVSVSLLGVKGASPATLSAGLYVWPPEHLYSPSGPPGPVDFAQVTFEDGAALATLPGTDSITQVKIAPAQSLSRFTGYDPNGGWTLSITNGGASESSQVAGGWMLSFHTAPRIVNSSNVVWGLPNVPVSFKVYVDDADGSVTNVTASIPNNPGFARISTLLNGNEVTLSLTGNPGQVGTNLVMIIATDNEGFSETNQFIFGLSEGPAISVSPPSESFGYYQVGTVVTRTFYVTNSGGGMLSGIASVPAPFYIMSTPSYNLQPGAWQAILVHYRPVTPGTNSAVITFTGGGGTARPVLGIARAQLRVGSAISGPQSTVVIPVLVEAGFTNMRTLQLSLHWDPAKASYLGVEQFGLPGVAAENFGTALTTNGTLTLSWDDPNLGCRQMVNGSTLFAVRFLVTASSSTTNSLSIDSLPLPFEAANCQLRRVPIEATMGEIWVVPRPAIAGKVVMHGTATPVPEVMVLASGPTNVWATTTAAGEYYAPVLPGGTYRIAPFRSMDTFLGNGASSLDTLLVRRHVLQIGLLDSPYKIIAADVDGSRSVDTIDIAWLRMLVLGATNSLPTGLWKFVPSDYVFPAPATPWSAPMERWATNLSNGVTGQDFLAIRIGDVNESWGTPFYAAAKARKERATPVVAFQISSDSARPGEQVVVNVIATEFTGGTSAQFTLEWDPTVLRYVGVGQFGLPGLGEGNFGTMAAESGRLTFAWEHPETAGVSLDSGATVFATSFVVVGKAGDRSSVALCDAPTPREASANVKLAQMITQDGVVTVTPNAPVVACEPNAEHSNVTLKVSTEVGVTYVIECTDSLAEAAWKEQGILAGDGAIRVWSDPAPNAQRRFYRVSIR